MYFEKNTFLKLFREALTSDADDANDGYGPDILE